MRFFGNQFEGAGTYIVQGKKELNFYELCKLNDKFALNEDSLSFFLVNGLIPFPYSPFKEVSALGVGDELQNNTHHINFPYFNNLSSNQTKPTFEKYLRLLSQSIQKKVKDKKAVLMLSSGKDSVALALAASKIDSTNITCVTYASENFKDDESFFASNLCKELGLTHKTIRLSNVNSDQSDLLNSFFQSSIFPISDPAAIPYILCLNEVKKELDFEIVLDGMGNDIYMGHVPSKNDIYKNIFNTISPYFQKARILIGHESKLNFFFNTRSENTFPGRLFSQLEINKFLDNSFNVRNFWVEQDKKYKNLDNFDFRSIIRGRNYDQNVGMMKGHLSSALFNAECFFPFCSKSVSLEYFNMQQNHRFNKSDLKNKVFLRKLLSHYINYPDLEIGKKIFGFEGEKFIQNNKDYIIDNIRACNMWNHNGVNQVIERIYKNNNSNNYYWCALYNLFMLSGWLNHSKYIQK